MVKSLRVCSREEVEAGLKYLPSYCEQWTLKEYSEALKLSPDNNYLLCRTAQSLYYTGALKNAVEKYETLLQKVPECTVARFQLGLAYFRLANLPAAERAFLNVIDIDNKFAMAYHRLGLTYYHLGKKEKAIEAYKKCLEKSPESLIVYYDLAVIYSALGKFREAVEALRYLTATFPNDAAAHYQLGMALSQLDEDTEALKCFKKAVEIDPEDDRSRRMCEVLTELVKQSEKPL